MPAPRILVPLDGSPLSEGILPVVAGLLPPRVTLLRVLPSQGDGGTVRDRLNAEAVLGQVAEQLRTRGVPRVDFMVRTGEPAQVILQAADREGAGLIALTTQGRSGYNRLVLGSVAEHVIRASPLPVLALREVEAAQRDATTPEPLRDVLVPHDGSELAWRAVETLALLGAAGKGTITLLGVVEAERCDEKGLDRAPATDLIARYRRAQIEHVRRDLERAAIRARDLGLEVAVDHAVGRPASAILDRAEARGATLIAMGSHGRSGLSRWTLGSVTEQVLRASTTPLLICK